MSRKVTRVYFRDDADDPRRIMDAANGAVFRTIAAYWLWGPLAVTTSAEMLQRTDLLRPIFRLCSKHGITADRLHRHPRVLAKVAKLIRPSAAKHTIRILHDIYECRDSIGFFILSRDQIVALASELPEHQKVQTPYIPPRIWTILMQQSLTFLDDFLATSDDYSRIFKQLVAEKLVEGGATTVQSTGPLDSLTSKWLPCTENLSNTLSSIATLVNLCASIQIVSYSLMRIEEASSLPLDCLLIERDAIGDTVYLLRGRTSKTIKDDDARWIVSSDCVRAVSAATIIANLRLECRQRHLGLNESIDPQSPLFPRSFEPWQGGHGKNSVHYWDLSVAKDTQELSRELSRFPRLLPESGLAITEADMVVSRHLNPMTSTSKIEVGLQWRFAWHQFRRTGAVNMLSSGLVSDLSLQYQLKHTGLTMSRYYGRGHVLLGAKMNEGARGEYVRNMYQVLAREFSNLRSNQYVSPYGDRHKDRLINIVSASDHRTLVSAAKSGKIQYRAHLLGGCASPKPCGFGGFENVVACSLPKPCEYLLYDKSRLEKYRILLDDARERLRDAPLDSPLFESLSGQVQALEGAISFCESNNES
ncbi:hypothetical protein VPH13_07790 [Stenotrophomonas pavanii]|uniref:hypothetical protein n=1 Tax=Stenotrophomonas pavanii TaxID=487698 RepID=UPI002DB5D513|nr:hypothetical protein [Stenotrophomonas pavanii]MEC4338617.1 hypothetical protein [Stenotrophomonas pavanii]